MSRFHEKLAALADEYGRLARWNLEWSPTFQPVAMLVTLTSESTLMQLTGDSESDSRLIARRAAAIDAVGLIAVNDAWYVMRATPEDVERLPRPRDDAERREAIVVTRATIGKVESAAFQYHRDGRHIVWEYQHPSWGVWVEDEFNRLAHWFSGRGS